MIILRYTQINYSNDLMDTSENNHQRTVNNDDGLTSQKLLKEKNDNDESTHIRK